MNYGLVGIYALYFIFVGSAGNAVKLQGAVGSDTKGFMPWLISIIILTWAYRSDTLRPIVKPFIFLAILVFVIKNYGKLVSQLNNVTGLNLPSGNTGIVNGTW